MLSALAMLGCVSEQPSVGTSTQSISTENRLVYNRLVYNRLVYNNLAEGELSETRLASGEMLYRSLDSLEETEGGRDLLAYVARCAFSEGDALVAEHDGVSYTMPGLLGLAPEWETEGLSDTKARLVSACLLAHVNAFGVSVPISLRSAGTIEASIPEMIEYPVYEATFFGDVFGSELRTFACTGSSPSIATSLSADRSLRVCSDDTPECAIESVGACRDVCEYLIPGYGWTDCWADGVMYTETMSTYLRYTAGSAGTDGYQACDDDDDCDMSNASTSEVLDCSGTENCDLECSGSNSCSLLGALVDDKLDAKVSHGAQAEIECYGAEECKATCEDAGTECAIDCTDTGKCHAKCLDGASCKLDCSGSAHCHFRECDGDETVCSDGTVVCNGSCS